VSALPPPLQTAAPAGLLLLPTVAAATLLLGLDLGPGLALCGLLLFCTLHRFARTGEVRFGPANTLTLLRAALVLLLLLAAFDAPTSSWPLFGVAAAALLLDALDGRVARRFSCASPFGARFDIEVDTAFLFTVALLLHLDGRAGVWVLAAGLLRPAFLLAGRLLPPLARPLPRSRRRAIVCGVAATALTFALAPPLPEVLAASAAGAAVLALTLSFARDVHRLLRASP